MAAMVFDRRVDKSQFRLIAAHWLTNKSMEQSEQNRTNRSKLDDPHCTGTKSFPRIIHTMTEKANGVRPSRAEVYIHSRTRKDGSIVNEKAAEVVERMKRGLDENNSESDQRSWHDDVYSQVKGPEKKGRVRCMGTASTSSLKSTHASSQIQQKEKVERLEAEVHELKEVLGNVLSLLQRQFPNENVNVLTTAARLLNREVSDADSGPSSRPKNRSSACSHQLDENDASDDAP